VRRFMTLLVLSLVATPVLPAQSAGDLLQIEIAAARRALTGNIARNMIVVDSMYARPGVAPGNPTSNARPQARTQALREAVSVPSTYTRPYGQTLLLLSAPSVSGDAASVTTTTFRVAQSGRRTSETLQITLRRQGNQWVVAKAEPLRPR
jgi:hypothetical protein